ncbi:hypothetical protein VHEMI03342 [[Torrubiella] hemipterigena]|uniref:Uncharacterized protein n=1 Tax=[Torrubiella] hemipterigena TaxID=1531966 RepID=A0A0A1TAJ7_9HYPO|nr:hypothetical protein VHEMI03342 [[Torrubiella] hemipterigena]
MQFFHLFCLVALAAASPQLPTPVGPPPPLTPADGSTSTPVPVVPPPPPTKATTETPKPPAPTPDGPICECGYTYCGSVLMTMKKPWNQKQLGDAYCKTPNASCPNNKPSSDVHSALYLCLCDGPDQKLGTTLDLLCGCDKCLNVGPDNRARCETPCVAATHK